MNTNDFIDFIATHQNGEEDPERIPSLGELSKEMGISVSKLREQLEAARTLGFVEVRPRTGIRRKPYSFTPAATKSLLYAIVRDRDQFAAFSKVRINIETSFWCEAVSNLLEEDIQELQGLLESAWDDLNGNPIIIPHREHRQLHLTIFKRLGNPFVSGLLETYWNAYEAVELGSYADLSYLREVWTYHERIVNDILRGDVEDSLQAFIEHTKLLRIRPAG